MIEIRKDGPYIITGCMIIPMNGDSEFIIPDCISVTQNLVFDQEYFNRNYKKRSKLFIRLKSFFRGQK